MLLFSVLIKMGNTLPLWKRHLRIHFVYCSNNDHKKQHNGNFNIFNAKNICFFDEERRAVATEIILDFLYDLFTNLARMSNI